MAEVRNLLIDFGGVLIDLDRQRCIDRFAALGCADLGRRLDAYHQEGFFRLFEEGKVTPEAFRNEVRRMTGKAVADEEIDGAWNSFLVGIPAGKLELLLRLRSRYRVFLLSNTNDIHWRWSVEHAFPLRTYRVEDYFEKTYLSFEMKMVKPGREIFEAVLADAGIDPQETFFIDDSVQNCQTAQQLGIRTYTPKACEDWSHLFNAKGELTCG